VGSRVGLDVLKKREIIAPLWNRTAIRGRSGRILVIIPTELSRLVVVVYVLVNYWYTHRSSSRN
jgi:hypothetical protein